MKRLFGWGLLLVALVVIPAVGQTKKKKDEPATRDLKGTISLPDGSPANGAVVQLRDTATQQIRSYIAKEDGSYHFASLKTDGTYQVRSEKDAMTADWKTLSAFDNRREPVINLKLEPKK